jgi:hypothetical protein
MQQNRAKTILVFPRLFGRTIIPAERTLPA